MKLYFLFYKMKPMSSVILFCGIFALAIFSSDAEENREVDKRYVAALAKNGRLPKFANAQKKDHPEGESVQSSETDEDYSKDSTLPEEKRHVGAFLKQHGKPNFMRSSNSFDDTYRDEKRNIASMARLGRLHPHLRSARTQPFSAEGKRMSSGEETSDNDEDNALSLFEDPDCVETAEEDRPIWIQKKRYVAALARSGRLPIWHSQRMWSGGKRDDSRPYSSSRNEVDHGENALDDMPFPASKNRRCKKVYEYQMNKRNVAALARNGKLPFRLNA